MARGVAPPKFGAMSIRSGRTTPVPARRRALAVLLEEEHVSAACTAGAVLAVGLIGAMVAFAAVGAVPVRAAPAPAP